MKITNLHLSGFKPFGEMVNIPIKPITLIFGPNSSGKSSILQSFLLMKQSLSWKNTLNVNGDSFDFGSYRNLAHKGKITKPITIGFTISTNSLLNCGLAAMQCEEGNSDIEFHWREYENVDIDIIRLFNIFERYNELRIELVFSGARDPSAHVFLGKSKKKLFSFRREGTISSTALTHPFWKSYWEEFDKDNITDLLNTANAAAKIYEEDVTEIEDEKFFSELVRQINDPTIIGYDKAKLCYKLLFLYADFLGSFNGFFPKDVNYTTLEEIMFRRDFAEHSERPWLQRSPAILPIMFGYLFRSFFREEIKYNGSLRDVPERFYKKTTMHEKNEVIESENIFSDIVYSYNSSDRIKHLNQELKLIGSDHRLKIVRYSAPELEDEGIFSLCLENKRTCTLSNIKDVGFGFSQMLPILINSQSQRDSFISSVSIIEQPELHLHPSIQANLGDHFLRHADKNYRFIIETHSEHLILRLLRRIRETSSGELPEDIPPLTPDDIAVLYVHPGKNGSEVIEIPVTEDGDFAQPWPQGFFPERAQELF